MYGLVRSHDLFGGLVLHWLGKNDIAVVVVDNEHVVVAARGWENEAAREIAEDLASDGAANSCGIIEIWIIMYSSL